MTRGDETGWSTGRLVAMGLLGLVFGALLATSGAQLLIAPEPAPPPAVPDAEAPHVSGQDAAPPAPSVAEAVPSDVPAPAVSPPPDRAGAPAPVRDTSSTVAGNGRHDAPSETAALVGPGEAVAQRPALPAPTEVKPVDGAVGTVGTLAAEPAAPSVGPGREAPAVAGDAAQRPVPGPAPAKQVVARPKEVTASSLPDPGETTQPAPSSPEPALEGAAPREPSPRLAPRQKTTPEDRGVAARRQDPPADASAPRLRGGVGAYTTAPDGLPAPAAPGFVVMDGAGAADVIRVIVPRGGR